MNLIVFEAIRNEHGHIIKIDRYWIIHHPPSIHKRRKSGILHDRAELNLIENNIFSIKTTRQGNKNVLIKFPIVSSNPLTLVDDITGAHCYMSDYLIVDSIFIQLKKQKQLIPRVIGVHIKGRDINTGKPTEEYIKAPSLKEQFKIRQLK